MQRKKLLEGILDGTRESLDNIVEASEQEEYTRMREQQEAGKWTRRRGQGGSRMGRATGPARSTQRWPGADPLLSCCLNACNPTEKQAQQRAAASTRRKSGMRSVSSCADILKSANLSAAEMEAVASISGMVREQPMPRVRASTDSSCLPGAALVLASSRLPHRPRLPAAVLAHRRTS